MALPAISPEGHTVETLTQEVQDRMTEGLTRLHQKVIKSPT